MGICSVLVFEHEFNSSGSKFRLFCVLLEVSCFYCQFELMFIKPRTTLEDAKHMHPPTSITVFNFSSFISFNLFCEPRKIIILSKSKYMYNQHSYREICPPLVLILLYLVKNSSSWENRLALNKAESGKHIIPFLLKGKTVFCVRRVRERALLHHGFRRGILLVYCFEKKKLICSTAEIKYFTVSLWTMFMKIYRFK